MSQPVCIDDFGTALYRCRYTAALVGGSGAALTGALVPGVSVTYVMGTSPEAKAAAKASRKAFDEMDANCNMCRNLERQQVGKVKGGFLYGTCKAGFGRGVMRFHPNDFMGMECWEPRP